ncbi:hypothetical protein [Umezawaea beigongshangensis]|uniref:hypothetical protein n=1 Tax=Umezawaea beigongshangensis TaxID=2780383 RepID=UPI0018F1FECE|nr:hypothetical protein [Umezawaea beigongshangensis]
MTHEEAVARASAEPVDESAPTTAPASREDVRAPLFRCERCDGGLGFDLDALVCTDPECPAAGTGVELWRAQERRVDLGLDVPAPGPGFPRPLLRGLPHPYVTPVTAGRPWWSRVDARRLQHCQLTWSCQVCGLPLPTRAKVLAEGNGDVRNDSALHGRCLRVAAGRCPNLTGAGLRVVDVTADDLLADGRPLVVDRGATATGDRVSSWVLHPARPGT